MRVQGDAVLFGYGRVSTSDQHTDSQHKELVDAGWPIRAWYAESISGGTMASQRPEWGRLLSDMKAHLRTGLKVALVVSKLDRLGRDAIDVQSTVRALSDLGIRVYVHQLGDVDLTSTTGKPMLAMLCAFAEFERDLIVERTQAGLARAKAEGKQLGRPASTTPEQREQVRRRYAEGESVSALARAFRVSRGTVLNIVRAD